MVKKGLIGVITSTYVNN